MYVEKNYNKVKFIINKLYRILRIYIRLSMTIFFYHNCILISEIRMYMLQKNFTCVIMNRSIKTKTDKYKLYIVYVN